MAMARKALGDITPSSLNSRLETDRPSTSKGAQLNNENPFATKNVLLRSPDAYSLKKRKSVTRILVDPPVSAMMFESENVERQIIASPPIVVKAYTPYQNNSTRKESHKKEVVDVQCVEMHDESDEFDPEIEAMTSRLSMIDHSEYNAQENPQIEFDLDELNINEVLQAFREDAEAAEKAIIVATTCGRLLPREFREYLRAFMSPKNKQSPRPKASVRYLVSTDPGFNLQGVDSDAVEAAEESISAIYRTHTGLESQSPKSSLLNMLEMADTPVAGEKQKEALFSPLPSYSEVVENVPRERSAVEEGRHQSLKTRTEAMRLMVATAVASVSNITFPTPTHTASSTHIPTPSVKVTIAPIAPQIAKTPLLRETPKALISTPTPVEKGNEEEYFLPKRVIMRTPPRHVQGEVSVLTQLPIENNENIPLDEILMRNTIAAEKEKEMEIQESKVQDPSSFSANIDVLNSIEKTSFKNVPETVTFLVAKNVPVEISGENMMENSPMKTVENIAAVRSENFPMNVPSSGLGCALESLRSDNIDDGENVPMSYGDDWSVPELHRVSNVMRRVSLSASECPYTRNIMKQLQTEINRLKYEVNVHHNQLAEVTADRLVLTQRLQEAESKVQDTSKNMQSLVDIAVETRTVAYQQGRIDAEIQAAKECVVRLAANKELIVQRRARREEQLRVLDLEVSAELASLDARRLRKENSGLSRLKMIADELVAEHSVGNVLSLKDPSDILNDNNDESDDDNSDDDGNNDDDSCDNTMGDLDVSALEDEKPEKPNHKNNKNNKNILNKKISSPSEGTSNFFDPPQRLIPSPDCIFFAPNPTKNPAVILVFENEKSEKSAFTVLNPTSFTAFSAIKKVGDGSDSCLGAVDVVGASDCDNNSSENGVNGDGEIIEKNDIMKGHDDGNNGDNINDDNISIGTDGSIHEFNDNNNYDNNNENNDNNNLDNNEFNSNMSFQSSPIESKNENENNGNDPQNEIISPFLLKTIPKKMQKKQSEKPQNTENNTENRKNPVNYYGNLKFVPLKVKSVKPRPIDDHDYLKSEGFYVKSENNHEDNGGEDNDEDDDNGRKGEKKNKKNSVKRVKKEKICVEMETEIDEASFEEKKKEDEMKEKPPKKEKKEKKENVLKEPKAVKPKIVKNIPEKKIVNYIEKDVEEEVVFDDVAEVGKEVVAEEMVSAIIGQKMVEKNGDKNEEIKIKETKKRSQSKEIKQLAADNENREILTRPFETDKKKELKKDTKKHDSKLIGGSVLSISPISEEKDNTEKISKKSIISEAMRGDEITTNNSQNARTVTPYALYCLDRKPVMRKKFPHYSPGELIKILSIEWKNLSGTEKAVWGRKSSLEASVQAGNVPSVGNVPQNVEGEDIVDSPSTSGQGSDDSSSSSSDNDNNNDNDIDNSSDNIGTATDDSEKPSKINKNLQKNVRIKLSSVEKGMNKENKVDIIVKSVENIDNDDDEEDEEDLFEASNTKLKKGNKRKNKGEASVSKRGRPNATETKKTPAVMITKETKGAEALFSSTLSLSPVLSSSPSDNTGNTKNIEKVEKIEKNQNMQNIENTEKINENKNERSLKRKDIVTASETIIPFPSTLNVNFNNNSSSSQLISDNMPPPAFATKKKTKLNMESDPSSAPKVPAPIPAKSLLNSSMSTVSSMFSTTSTIRSKSSFVLPKLKKKN